MCSESISIWFPPRSIIFWRVKLLCMKLAYMYGLMIWLKVSWCKYSLPHARYPFMATLFDEDMLSSHFAEPGPTGVTGDTGITGPTERQVPLEALVRYVFWEHFDLISSSLHHLLKSQITVHEVGLHVRSYDMTEGVVMQVLSATCKVPVHGHFVWWGHAFKSFCWTRSNWRHRRHWHHRIHRRDRFHRRHR